MTQYLAKKMLCNPLNEKQAFSEPLIYLRQGFCRTNIKNVFLKQKILNCIFELLLIKV